MTEFHPDAVLPAEEAVEPAYEDYFGFTETAKWYLPDGLQYIETRKMTEGDRKRYQTETRTDLTLERATGNARMRMDPGTERWTLLQAAIVGWHLVKRNERGSFKPVTFTKQALDQWLGAANPKLIDDLEKHVRKQNAWLLSDQTVEEIDKEIESLKELREAALKRESGEGVSSNK